MTRSDFLSNPSADGGGIGYGTPRVGAGRTPTIADRFSDLLDPLTERQRRAIIHRLTTGYYEGWRPSRSEIADLVAVELGLLPIDESLQRQRRRAAGERPPDLIHHVLQRRIDGR